MRLAVVGAGGCAREVAWTVREAGHEFLGFIVTDLAKVGDLDDRERILGDLDWLESHLDTVEGLVIGIGAPSTRRRVVDQVRDRFPTLPWPTVVAGSLVSDRTSCTFSSGVVVCPVVVATVNVTLEAYSMVHYGTTIGHESRIGAFSVVNPGANIAGGVTIEEEVMVGSGAVILQYRKVGRGATIGAGAVVTKDVPAGETWVGIPAARLN